MTNDTINIMVVGSPAVGKSYFINALLGCQTPNKCGDPSQRFPVPGTYCYKDCSGYATVSGSILYTNNTIAEK